MDVSRLKAGAYKMPPDAAVLTLDGLHANCLAFARDCFAEAGEVRPTFVATSTSPPMLYSIPTPWSCEADKVQTLSVLRGFFAAMNVTCYAVVSEMWMAAVDLRTNPELAGVPPSERNDREEKLWILTTDGDRMRSDFLAIVRDEAGARLGEIETVPAVMEGSGRMVDLLRRLTAH